MNGEHEICCMIERISMDHVNTAMERLDYVSFCD
jgi:hypothetical protein